MDWQSSIARNGLALIVTDLLVFPDLLRMHLLLI